MTLNANSNPAYIALQAYMGTSGGTQEKAIQFESNWTLTGAAVISQVANVPGNSTVNVPINAYSVATAPVFFAVFDDTPTPGQNFGINTGGQTQYVAPNSFWGYACDGINPLPSNVNIINPNSSNSTIRIVTITN